VKARKEGNEERQRQVEDENPEAETRPQCQKMKPKKLDDYVLY
jgi:hypothetical protein